jgi:hypothetical protein
MIFGRLYSNYEFAMKYPWNFIYRENKNTGKIYRIFNHTIDRQLYEMAINSTKDFIDILTKYKYPLSRYLKPLELPYKE